MEGVKNTEDYYRCMQVASEFVRNRLGVAEIAIVLGSGLNGFTEELENRQELPYHDIPHLPQTTVKGHAGKLVFGQINGRNVFCLAGRSHSYEGRFMHELTFMARVLALLGVKLLIATNASGGSGEGMYPGCLMLIKDHINFWRRNPLADTAGHDGLCTPYPDMSHLYSTRVMEIAKNTANRVGVRLFEGIYGATCGPTYETPSEVKAFHKLGASAFGMSTVPETMAGAAIGMEVFAMSLITNLAAGMSDEILTHSAVTEVANESGPNFVKFMKALVTDVTLKDVKILSPSASPQISVLPKPQMKAATQQQIKEAVEYVRSSLPSHNNNNAKTALYLTQGHDSFSNQLQNVHYVNYESIPHFPLHGTNRFGKLGSGEFKGKQLIVLLGHSLNGYLTEDATFLTELLKHLGVERIVHTFTVASTSKDAFQERDIVLLKDCMDTSTVHPYPHTIEGISADQYPVKIQPFSTTNYNNNNNSASAVYSYIAGPSFPTPAEVSAAKMVGSQLVGITSLTAVYSARFLGMEVVGVAEVVSTTPSTPFTDYSFNEKLVPFLENILSKDPEGEQRAVSLKDPKLAQQVTFYLSYPVIQGIYSQVEESASFVQQRLQLAPKEDSSSIKTAIVIDSSFQGIEEGFEQGTPTKLSYSEIPHFKLEGTIHRTQLVPGKKQGEVLVLQGTGFLHEGRPSSDIGFPVRLLGHLGVSNIIFVSPVCGVASQGLTLGQLVTVRDHVMLSGRNPLFGLNEDRWGTRFPDVSEAYSKHIRNILTGETGNIEKGLAAPVVAGNVVGPVIGSFADAHSAEVLGLQVLTTGVAPEVVVSRHMGINAACLGLITATINAQRSEVSKLESVSSHFQQIQKVLASAVAELAIE